MDHRTTIRGRHRARGDFPFAKNLRCDPFPCPLEDMKSSVLKKWAFYNSHLRFTNTHSTPGQQRAEILAANLDGIPGASDRIFDFGHSGEIPPAVTLGRHPSLYPATERVHVRLQN